MVIKAKIVLSADYIGKISKFFIKMLKISLTS
jgi:hypothetical protein